MMCLLLVDWLHLLQQVSKRDHFVLHSIPMNIRVGAITLSRVGSIAETEYNLVSPAYSTSTWLWYAGITSPTNGLDFSLFTSTVFNVIFDRAGAPTPNIPQQVKYFSEVNFMLPPSI